MRWLIAFAHLVAGSCLLGGTLISCTGCVAISAPTGVSVPPRQLLLTLQREMNSNSGWVRIHAAEALLDHHHAQPVTRLLLREADTAQPPYRMGVWRVLARATGTAEERQMFIDRIRRAMLDPQAPDRVHAAESLAKLGAASPSDTPALLEWVAAAREADAVYPLWLLALSGNSSVKADSEGRLGDLLESGDTIVRLRAAFALGRITIVSPRSIGRLNQCLALEPEDSPVRAYAASALLRHAEENSSGATRLKQVLAEHLARGQPSEQLEAAIALGMRGTTEDLPVLARLADSPEADARIGATSGSLYILEAGASLLSH